MKPLHSGSLAVFKEGHRGRVRLEAECLSEQEFVGFFPVVSVLTTYQAPGEQSAVCLRVLADPFMQLACLHDQHGGVQSPAGRCVCATSRRRPS